MTDYDDDAETKLSPAAKRSLSEMKAAFEPRPQDFQRIRQHVAAGLAAGTVATAAASSAAALALKGSLVLSLLAAVTVVTVTQLNAPSSRHDDRSPRVEVTRRGAGPSDVSDAPAAPISPSLAPQQVPNVVAVLPTPQDRSLTVDPLPPDHAGSSGGLGTRESVSQDVPIASPQLRADEAAPAPETHPSDVSQLQISESTLISRAQRALERGDEQTLAATLGQHMADFPHGLLAEEREAIRAIGECRRLARDPLTDRARFARIRADFEQHHSQAFALERVRRECAHD